MGKGQSLSVSPPTLDTFHKLVGESKTEHFAIPDYQRHYVWDRKQISILFEDLFPSTFWSKEQALQNDKDSSTTHRQILFLGCIVLCNDGSTKRSARTEIIDGQQRILTISLVAHHCYQTLLKLKVSAPTKVNAEDEVHLLEVLRAGDGPLKERGQRIEMRSDDKAAWQAILENDDLEEFRVGESSALIAANQAVKEHIDRELACAEQVGIEPTKATGVIAQRFLHNTHFIKFVAHNEIQAFTLFETLNFRGVPLNSADLTKNKILQIAHRQDAATVRHCKRKWKEIEQLVGRRNTEQFLHHYWIGHFERTGRDKLFDKVRSHLHGMNVEKLTLFVDNLSKAAKAYAQFLNPAKMKGQSNDAQQSKAALIALKMLGAKTVYIPLLLCRTKFSTEFNKVIRLLESITVMGAVGALQSNEIDLAFKNACAKFAEGTVPSERPASLEVALRDQFDALSGVTEFEDKFSTAVFARNGAKLRAILARLESAHSGGISELDLLGSSEIDIEHIHASESDEDTRKAQGFIGDKHDKLVNQIGNLTLWHRSPNRMAQDKPYIEKRTDYKKSKVEMTRLIGRTHATWSPKQVADRGKTLAKVAIATWQY